MFAVQKIARQAPQLAKLAANQRRTLVSTPPRCRIPFTEMVVHGVAFYVGVMAIPIYVSLNVRSYSERAS